MFRRSYLRARRDMDDALALRLQHGGKGPSAADLEQLAQLMMRSERADEAYLRMLAAFADEVIDEARRGRSEGRTRDLA